jgi:hypothetical protein
MHNTQLESFPYFLGSLIVFYLMLYAEKDLCAPQDVAGAYFNEGIFSGAMSSGGSTSSALST